MWQGPHETPGPPVSEGASEHRTEQQSEDLLDDSDQQQQLLIAQWKEIIRKTEQTSMTAEKVEEFAQTLAKAKRNKLKRGADDGKGKVASQRGPTNEKVLLLRQQLEENKAKIAARGKNQKGIEEKITQLKAQLNDSQYLLNQSTISLNVSHVEPATKRDAAYSVDSSADELYHILQSKEKSIDALVSKVEHLEAYVLDLNENLKEKDSVIDARTKAITLMSENLSKKGKHTLDTLEETKEQMRNMQEEFVRAEEKLQSDKQKLLQQLYEKDEEIADLKDKNLDLEHALGSASKITQGNESVTTTTTIFASDDESRILIAELQERIKELENSSDSSKTSPNKSRRNRKQSKQRMYDSTNQNTEMEAKIAFQQSIISDKEMEIASFEQQIESMTATISELKTTIINFKGGDVTQKKQSESSSYDLVQLNDELQKKVDTHIASEESLKSQVEECKSKIQQLQFEKKAFEFSDATITVDNTELENLKKQLDESNKNMIKARAQHKSQIKELNKKLEVYKKGDVHKVETENLSLSQKIAELEEQLGNIQLKMVESTDSMKNSAKLDGDSIDFARDKVGLEEKLIKRDHQIKELTAKLDLLQIKETAQVKSDLNSIHLEEQLEFIEREKTALENQISSLLTVKSDLENKIESIESEKKELSTKADLLLQENLDLIDRLEKLSAEKVSSAESIEMVEGLTAQEKLELETYQNLSSTDSAAHKSEEHLAVENVELNDSVNQLTEETAELLQRIELFTVERREVMEKLDQLSQENSQLLNKVKEIESSRDALNDVHEQLLSEKNELHDSYNHLMVTNSEYIDRYNDLQDQYVIMSNEKTEIAELLEKRNSELDRHINASKDTTHLDEINIIKSRINDLEDSNNEYVSEIENYQSIIEENKNELIASSNLIAKLQSDFELLKSQSALKEVEQASLLNTQIQELQHVLDRKVIEIENNVKQLQSNDQLIADFTNKLNSVESKLRDYEFVLKRKDQELADYANEKQEIIEETDDLRLQLADKEEHFKRIVENLKDKCISLQNELESTLGDTTDPLQSRITELENKNKELRDKLKIVAANLKKKSAAFDELKAGQQQQIEKWESEANEKNALLTEVSAKMSTMQEQLDEFANLNAEYKNQLTILNDENEVLRSGRKDSQNVEMHRKETQIAELCVEIESNRSTSGIVINTHLLKIKELEMYIESLQQDLTQSRERVEKLEEGLARVEERRMSVERRATELGAKLQEKEINIEEVLQNEDMLEKRLRILAEHDAAVDKKLTESVEENKELYLQNSNLLTENAECKQNLEHSRIEIQSLNEKVEHLIVLQTKNCELNSIVKQLQIELSKVEKEYNNSLEKQRDESVLSEQELNDQLLTFNAERKALNEKNEMLLEHMRELQDSLEHQNTVAGEFQRKLQEQNNELDAMARTIADLNGTIASYEDLLRQKDTELTGINSLNDELQAKQCKITELNRQLGELTSERSETASQLDFLKNMMQQIEENNISVLSRNDELERRIVAAEEEINRTKSHAAAIPPPTETVTLFGASQVFSDPFSFVTEPEQIRKQEVQTIETQATTSRNVNEDLSSKIRSLEILLHNSEQEKEELLQQCGQLSSELATLVYEKQRIHSAIDVSDIASQIVPHEDAFVSAEDNVAIAKSRCVEPTFSSSSQYFDGAAAVPVVEEAVQSKSAYLCFDNNSESAVFGENDDGWGFPVDEPRLLPETSTSSVDANNVTSRLQEQIRLLELERDKYLEDLRQSQVKCAKLLKKLKEFKVKNDQLTAEKVNRKSDGLDDLEFAIQDELKAQVDKLEKKLKDIQADLEREKTDKANILSRVDVLTSANERLVEMKEKQDVQILVCQQQNRELTSKLEQLEWGHEDNQDESKNASPKSIQGVAGDGDSVKLRQQVAELNCLINELTLDNEELQHMLDEQQRLRKVAEKQQVVAFSSDDIKSSSEYKTLLQEKQNIAETIQRNQEENARQQSELKIAMDSLQSEKVLIVSEIESLRNVVTENENAIEHLQSEVRKHVDEIDRLNLTVSTLTLENQSVKSELSKSLESVGTMYEAINAMENDKSNLEDQLRYSDDSYNEKCSVLQQENESLKAELEKTRGEIANVNDSISILNLEKTELCEQLANAKAEKGEISELHAAILQKDQVISELKANESEFETKMATTLEQVAHEWSLQVDQRGCDIAESWKLHLDAKENEFIRIEDELRKELNELDQKCVLLVNENNELRKNVDADIRNEVDRMSGLQQQISDKQHCVNELNHVVEEKTMQLNDLAVQLAENEQKIQQMNALLQEKDAKLIEFEKDLETRQLDLEDKQSRIDELAQKVHDNVEDDGRKELILQEKAVTIQDLQSEIMNQQQINQNLSALVKDLQEQLKSLDEYTKRSESDSNVITQLNLQIQTHQHQLSRMANELTDRESTIEDLQGKLNSESSHVTEELRKKDQSIAELNRALTEKDEELSYMAESQQLENNNVIIQQSQEIDTLKRRLMESETAHGEIEALKRCLMESETQHGELVSVKDQDLAAVQSQLKVAMVDQQVLEQNLQQYQANLAQYQEILATKENEIYTAQQYYAPIEQAYNDLSARMQEQDLLHEGELKQLDEMRNIIESQVLKIEELKHELFAKSSDYDSIIAEMDMHIGNDTVEDDNKEQQAQGSAGTSKRVHFAEPHDDLSEPVSRAELDLALYMLHQRDVRCEELTLELTHLLEERDTLQLRLSNAIRERELVRSQQQVLDVSAGSSQTAMLGSGNGEQSVPKTRAILLGATNTEMAAEATEMADETMKKLHNKLSELKTIGYRRDKTIVDEQDQRRMQLSLIQHMGEASKLPAEAAARLVDANYTLSRDVQSPSKVLLDWFWGRSTPKVNNI